LLKKNDEAIDFLSKAIKDGYAEFDHMKQDSDLDNIRNDERYKKLMGEK
jgi:hypothetical protein